MGVDIAAHMLHVCRDKAGGAPPAPGRIELAQSDAEALPFASDALDVVLSSMVLGMVPDEARTVAELARVLRPGGTLALATHGPDHYWEAIDAAFRAVPKRHVLGYRLELWPRSEQVVRRLLLRAGMRAPRTLRLRRQEPFAGGDDAYDFFAATSASWWLTTVPADLVDEASAAMRRGFVRHRIDHLTMDVVLAHAVKPA